MSAASILEGEMNRREFLRYSAFCGLSVSLADFFSSTRTFSGPIDDKVLLNGFGTIYAHAHPDRYVRDPRQIDNSSTLKAIKELGMVASCFAAVGDSVFLSRGRQPGTEYGSAKTQLEFWIKGPIRQGKLKQVLKASDIPDAVDEKTPPGAILAIEGGDPLGGKPDRLDEFYRLGVRMITLVHYRNNELGDIMRAFENSNPGPGHNGLTEAGRRVVERMQELGMVVDVAHVHSATLRKIAEISSKPLVDSHTNPCAVNDPLQCGRLRTWNDMEVIVKTGGVVCTWPMAYERGESVRVTFLDWAKEILEMKKRLGIEHVGLGTDGGGGLPKFIEGYRDIRDLVHLAAAMEEVGLSQEDIKSYMGGNFRRVLQSCIG
jgi:microsomal dipeptidase-like Zn-dependent dipeptidase